MTAVLRMLARIRSEWRHAPGTALLFFACVFLSVAAFSGVENLRMAADRMLKQEARSFIASDMEIRSAFVFSHGAMAEVKALEESGRIRTAFVTEFLAMALPEEGRTGLVSVKAVSEGYPFYGQVTLASDGVLGEILQPGILIAEPMALRRLGVGEGERLQLGDAFFTVKDAVLSEPDRPIDAAGLAPRVFIHHKDLDATGLAVTGSRVRHRLLVALSEEGHRAAVKARLSAALMDGTEELRTYEDTGNRALRWMDSLFYYLRFCGIGILVLAGFGIRGSLVALWMQREKAVALMKTLGATPLQVGWHMALFLASIVIPALLAGWLAGWFLALAMGSFMAEMLPRGLVFGFSMETLLLTLLVGGGFTLLFSILPFSRMVATPPVRILHRGENSGRAGRTARILFWAGVAGLLVLAARMLQEAGGSRVPVLIFMASMAATAAAAWLLVQLAIRFPARGARHRVVMQALKRPGATPVATVVSMAIATGLVLALVLMERNLSRLFLDAFPENTPNLYVIDIQPSQREAVADLLGPEALFFPMVRARVLAVNERPIDAAAERKKRGDNLGREFSLTWHGVMEDEALVEGESLFRDDLEEAQVSILDYIRETYPLRVGDRITFRIQGVSMTAVITSVRKRQDGSLRPFFVFNLREKDLVDVPHTLFAALSADGKQQEILERNLAEQFSNIRIIDVREMIERHADLARQMAGLLRAFSMLAFGAGILVWLGGLAATAADRARDAVLFRVVGADHRFLLETGVLETGIQGLLAVGLGFFIAEGLAGFVVVKGFGLDFNPELLLLSGCSVLALFVIVLLGTGAAWPSMGTRPADAVRGRSR
ncbi:putative ABC transport system permease protein [Desulfobotulus alkaliphilus]|uniref:Putative ABC transport system permease protein n=1 Tax=Desulfobotulus alkaliphilus TaxID=622671 RepID=A0A562RPI7_9BACT|nr:FtsX-like permease family protein [Desulfobotulus alkaliphilus]TWI70280.1 putative ABC transport system permease protein [Desulfobotulus alkaliphilus]